MTEVVLITGCATGIGRGLAENLALRTHKDGKPQFKVWATDYRLEGVKDLEEKGMAVAQLDVSSSDSINAAVDLVLTTDGRIDMLVCNAGLTAPGYLTEIDYMDVHWCFNVNVHGVFRTIQPVAKSMMARRSGKIAILSSVNAYFVQPWGAPYSGTKAAVAIMAESLRIELAPFNISVTSVCPAWVKSDIVHNSTGNYERYERPDSFYAHAIDNIRDSRLRGVSTGVTVQKAADEICNGLAKKWPTRYLYTGTLLLFSLFWGFWQQWIGLFDSTVEAIIEKFQLPEAATKAPMEWAGHFVKPDPIPETLKKVQNGQEVEVLQNGHNAEVPFELRKEE